MEEKTKTHINLEICKKNVIFASYFSIVGKRLKSLLMIVISYYRTER